LSFWQSSGAITTINFQFRKVDFAKKISNFDL
jgi:hypothetical protein